MARKPVLLFLAVAFLVGLAALPIWVARNAQLERRHFRTVREGILYRSGQMTLDGLARSIHDHGIRSVVTFRASNRPGKPDPDAGEEAWCKQEGIRYLRLPPLHWQGEDSASPPVEENLKKYLQFLSDASNYPILIHCFAGIHRTGAYCAVYRMEVEGWERNRAMEEMRACGYVTLEENEDIFSYLRNYTPGRLKTGLPTLQTGVSPIFDVGRLVPAGAGKVGIAN